ncbi:MAG: SufE family protein [Bacteroidetes bacterium]|jgi:cysteine desulfuration protein SufE|nr:MAG: Fe-S metabolism protein SufE [Cryomorphaceae bacterium BACL29 MAG-121220-bin8]MDA0757284.1 SufE family protein [Bacteroidota bacterium]MDA1019697.1 SufE family protein [Bacteroidota bacterium]
MTIKEIQDEIVEEFSLFENWMERYEYMIELGKSIELICPSNKTDSNLIKGCQSKLWLHAEIIEGKILYTTDSEAIITKGIAAILLRAYSNQTPLDIINSDIKYIDEIGLKEHLSPTRANGLVSMIRQIKYYALAFSKKNKIK